MQRFYYQNLSICPQVDIWKDCCRQDICKILQDCWVSGRKIQWTTETLWREANHPPSHTALLRAEAQSHGSQCLFWALRFSCRKEMWMSHMDFVVNYKDLINLGIHLAAPGQHL